MKPLLHTSALCGRSCRSAGGHVKVSQIIFYQAKVEARHSLERFDELVPTLENSLTN